MSALDPYIGLPYRLGAARRDGIDCWGLVLLAFRELRGIELPSYNWELSDLDRVPRGFVRQHLRVEVSRAWHQVPASQAQYLDVVSFRVLRPEDHVGLVDEDVRWAVTTSDDGIGARRVRWDRGSEWYARACAVYRYVG